MDWEIVVGLEVHVQLDTQTKLFSRSPNRFGQPPNTQVNPVEAGLPGSLPVLNDRAVDFGLMTALALGCDVPDESYFARKHYFYPDLPKGYQISQYDRPLALGGAVPIELDGAKRSVNLTRIHMEEDAGKSVHAEGDAKGESRIDLNRCGTPLLEIVSEPEIRRAEEAGAYLESLRRIVRYLRVSDGDMSQGSLRCDANVSVRPVGAKDFGTKTEVKNLNSIKAVEKAIVVEARRQISLLEAGEEIQQATLLWDDAREQVRVMRVKESAPDYRYFPEPDLMPLTIDSNRRKKVQESLPELPFAKRDRFVREFSIPEYDATVLTASRDVAEWFEELAHKVSDPKVASNWTMGEILRVLKDEGIEIKDFALRPADLAELLGLVTQGTISNTAAKDVFVKMMNTGKAALVIVEEDGLSQISDESEIESIVVGVLESHPEQVAQFRDGNEKVVGYLVGQVMKASQGKANPKLAGDWIRRLIVEA